MSKVASRAELVVSSAVEGLDCGAEEGFDLAAEVVAMALTMLVGLRERWRDLFGIRAISAIFDAFVRCVRVV